MSSHSPNLNNNNRPNKNFGELILLAYIMLNGVSTGGVIRTGRDIVANGADSNAIIGLMLYLGYTIYTAQRAYEVYKKIHNNDDKNNQR